MEIIDRPKKVLTLNKDYYITCDKYTWILVKKGGKGECDECVCYCPYFKDMLKIVATRFCRIPKDVQALGEKMDKIYNLIDKRIPENYRVKDLVNHLEGETYDNSTRDGYSSDVSLF